MFSPAKLRSEASSCESPPAYTGLPEAEDEQAIEILRGRIYVIAMGGHDGPRFAVPASLLSRLSDRLHKSASNIVHPDTTPVVLEPADEATFYRFYQFTYTGTYDNFPSNAQKVFSGCSSVATPSSTMGATGAAERQVEVSKPSDVVKTNDFQFPHSVRSMHDDLCRLAVSLTTPKKSSHQPKDMCSSNRKLKILSSFLRNCDSSLYQWPTEIDDEQISLGDGNGVTGHAKVWQLAESYKIDPLMDLARSRLARDLATWTITSDFMTDFGILVRYLYNNCSGRGNALQRLVAQYTECVMDDMKGLEDWQKLLMEVPAFGLDLVDILCDSR